MLNELIKHGFYINLDKRTDRRIHIESELTHLGLQNNVRRFPAILNKDNPALGCTQSHLNCLEIARDNNWDLVWICEDDAFINDPTEFNQALVRILSSRIQWDVILLGGVIIGDVMPVNRACDKIITGCQTTTGYIVRRHYYDRLISNIKEGGMKLSENPGERTKYAIDRYWIPLQQQHNWYILSKNATLTQYGGYSDIENQDVDYKQKMYHSTF